MMSETGLWQRLMDGPIADIWRRLAALEALEQSGGSVVANYTAVTAAYAVQASDYTVNCVGSFTVTLPATAASGRIFTIKNSGGETILVDTAGGELIDGEAEQTLFTSDSMTVQYTGAGWIIL